MTDNKETLAESLISGNTTEFVAKIQTEQKIRPVLVFKVSGYGISPSMMRETMETFGKQILSTVEPHEYIHIILPTRADEHSVELLNPNIIDEASREEYLATLEELRKEMHTFFENIEK